MESSDIKVLAVEIAANTIFTTKMVLTSDETAKYLGVSKSALYKWTAERKIPHFKSPTGKMCFFNRLEVEAWMQSQRVSTDWQLEQKAQKLIKGGTKK
jgi:excisionase family DNA binding protein